MLEEARQFGENRTRKQFLDSTDGGTAMFATGQKAESDIDLWHKRIGHVNHQRLQELQSKQVVLGLPKFSGRKVSLRNRCTWYNPPDFTSERTPRQFAD